MHLSQLDRNPLIQQNPSFQRALESSSNADKLPTTVVVPTKKKRGRPAKISRKVDEGKEHIAHLRQECHNSKFSIFELLVQKETFADALLTGIVS